MLAWVYIVATLVALWIIASGLRAELDARRSQARHKHYKKRAEVAAALVGATQESMSMLGPPAPQTVTPGVAAADPAQGAPGKPAPAAPPKLTLSEQAKTSSAGIVDELNAQAKQDPVAVSRALRALIQS